MPRVIYTPADLPPNCTIAPGFTSGESERTRAILARVRPDISFALAINVPADACYLLTNPDWREKLHRLRAAGVPEQRLLVMPELPLGWPDAEWAYTYWAVPMEMVSRQADGQLIMDRAAFESALTGMRILHGHFHGQFLCDGYRAGSTQDAPQLNAVLNILSDDASRVDFMTALFGAPERIWESWCHNLYNHLEYMDYVTISPGDTIVNCGVLGGMELPLFLAALDGRGRIVNIDPFGYDCLVETVRQTLEFNPGLDIEIRAAAHSEQGSVRLPIRGGMAVGGMAGRTLPGCEHRDYPARTVDAIVSELGLDRVDYLKMDIEGAEIEALKGSALTIGKFRPQLAISIYHEPSHFWRIPVMLDGVCPDYRFFVKHYHYHPAETILYAIPNERTVQPRRRGLEMQLTYKTV